MPNLVVTEDVVADLRDIHVGVHTAMTALINNKRYDIAELTLRQIDERFCYLLNRVQVAKR